MKNQDKFQIFLFFIPVSPETHVDPHTQTILRIETAFGDDLGKANPIDRIQNTHRKRQRPHQEESHTTPPSESMVEDVHQAYSKSCALPINKEEN